MLHMLLYLFLSVENKIEVNMQIHMKNKHGLTRIKITKQKCNIIA